MVNILLCINIIILLICICIYLIALKSKKSSTFIRTIFRSFYSFY